jgi:acyl-coenzyme A thioesterase PaaI-like protein
MEPAHPLEGRQWGIGDPDAEPTPLQLARRRAGGAVRQLIDQLAGTDASAEVLDDLADQLEELVGAFEGAPSAAYSGFAEAANAPDVGNLRGTLLDRSPVMGLANPVAPPLYLRLDDDRIEGWATFGAAYEGPPGCVHGGWIAAAFDEVLGATQTLSGQSGMTAFLHVDYRSPTPLHEELRFEGELDRVEGRKIFTVGRARHGEVVTAEAQALFIAFDFERFAEMQRQRTGRMEN